MKHMKKLKSKQKKKRKIKENQNKKKFLSPKIRDSVIILIEIWYVYFFFFNLIVH